MDIKMVIVVRKDLKMKKGKIAAQASHAALKVFFDRGETDFTDAVDNCPAMVIRLTPEMKAWAEGIFKKICVSVKSEEELLELYEKAKAEDIPCSLVTDAGHTVFNGVPTNTCIAIGPGDPEKVKALTGHLPLY
jgi:PTH2 family peptidyl-tRNA hydrolase